MSHIVAYSEYRTFNICLGLILLLICQFCNNPLMRLCSALTVCAFPDKPARGVILLIIALYQSVHQHMVGRPHECSVLLLTRGHPKDATLKEAGAFVLAPFPDFTRIISSVAMVHCRTLSFCDRISTMTSAIRVPGEQRSNERPLFSQCSLVRWATLEVPEGLAKLPLTHQKHGGALCFLTATSCHSEEFFFEHWGRETAAYLLSLRCCKCLLTFQTQDGVSAHINSSL